MIATETLFRETTTPAVGTTVVVERADLPQLFAALRARSYQVVGPTVRDGAIVYDDLAGVEDLPEGWTDRQEGGSYRLERRADKALFGYNVGPHSWKKFLHPPVLRLWQARRSGKSFEIVEEGEPAPKYAFIGVRGCELHAIAIQDRVFMQGDYVDPNYQARRDGLFVLAVNCGQAGGTCFCASMNSGPRVAFGYDLALTEVLSPGRHYFVVEVGTETGADVMGEVAHTLADSIDQTVVDEIVEHTASQMGRKLEIKGLKELLYRSYDSPRWDDIATRCLTCGNCTMVCPTCFCTSVEDTSDLAGQEAMRTRRWDSCFTVDYSYIHGGSIRPTPKSRYRQWMTHKLATWVDQFGTEGCVGCGRCITWCPVGIDITAEAQAIREEERSDANS